MYGLHHSLLMHTPHVTHLHVGSMNYTTRSAGSFGGLRVVLYANQHDYLYASSPSAGFRVSSISHTHL